MLFYLYTTIMILLTPYFLLRLWWKGRHVPAYRQRIAERFALNATPTTKVDIWVHAVSLGEVIAVTPLLEALLDKSYRLLVTTMTPTGSARVTTYFGDRVFHQYAPYDLPWVLNRFFKHYQPRLGLIMETELWPQLVAKAHQASVPLFLINGRLSQQSYKSYRWLKPLFKPILNQFLALFVQTEADRTRFIQLGTDEARVHALGNMKFDLNPQFSPVQALIDLKKQWGDTRPVVVLASTHDDEEQKILEHVPHLRKAIQDVLILIAPRHQDRFEKIVQLCKKMGYSTGRRSQPNRVNTTTQVVVLDAFGELMQAYACSDYAFVGGSLVPVGGHNVLEPISVGIPVFSGTHMHNFKAISESLSQAEALQLVDSPLAFIEALIDLHRDPEKKAFQVKRAHDVLRENRGVLDRYVERIESVLHSPSLLR